MKAGAPPPSVALMTEEARAAEQYLVPRVGVPGQRGAARVRQIADVGPCPEVGGVQRTHAGRVVRRAREGRVDGSAPVVEHHPA
jgi:hypothetical protein